MQQPLTLASLRADTIGDCVAEPVVLPIVRAAMQQAVRLSYANSASIARLILPIEKILKRFSNPYLSDECDRVGREPLQLANDRLIYPMLTAKGFGLPYDKLLLAIGAALHFDNAEDPQSVEIRVHQDIWFRSNHHKIYRN